MFVFYITMNTKGGLALRRGSAAGGGEVGFNYVILKFGYICNFLSDLI